MSTITHDFDNRKSSFGAYLDLMEKKIKEAKLKLLSGTDINADEIWYNQIQQVKDDYLKEKERMLFPTNEIQKTYQSISDIYKSTMSKTNKTGFDVPKGFPIPLNKSVILAKVVGEFKTKNGVLLNESAEENNVATIMAVADDCNHNLKPGTKVMYNIRENREILFEETYYLIMHETALFCILPDNAVLMPETIKDSVKKTREFQHDEKIRHAAMARKEENDFDKIEQTAKKKFNKKK